MTADHVLVLRNAGPQGGPGMPEWGMLPMPKKLLKQGLRDMMRMSDARMSGTSYGACVLHVSPRERTSVARLALLQTGDIVTVDVDARTINMEVSEAELAARAGPPGRRRRDALSSAAMAGCSPSTSSKPAKAATSISCAPSSARPVSEPVIY